MRGFLVVAEKRLGALGRRGHIGQQHHGVVGQAPLLVLHLGHDAVQQVVLERALAGARVGGREVDERLDGVLRNGAHVAHDAAKRLHHVKLLELQQLEHALVRRRHVDEQTGRRLAQLRPRVRQERHQLLHGLDLLRRRLLRHGHAL